MAVQYLPKLPTRARRGVKVHMLIEGTARTMCGKWTDRELVPPWSSCAKAWTDTEEETDCGSCQSHITKKKAKLLANAGASASNAAMP